MKMYLSLIKRTQQILLTASVILMMTLPLALVLYPDFVTDAAVQHLYTVSHVLIFFVMMVRPVADLLVASRWVRPLVILRKGAGVMSAAIAVSFLFAKLIADPQGYVAAIGSLPYWSLWGYAVVGHMADITAVVLLATSNNLSKKLLGPWWKRVQKLSYVYFYASALYVYLSYGDTSLLVAMALVTTVTLMAFIENRNKRQALLPA